MKRVYVDLHIHSALSPCADNDMTPHNIVQMSLLKNLDMIAVTDHNAIGNVKAALAAAKGENIIVVPGIEITTQEEVHLLGYFPSLSKIETFYEVIRPHLPGKENRPDIFGNQYLFNENDELIEQDQRLLMNAIQLDFDTMVRLICRYDGIPVPAHVNRDSFSVYSNMGFIPSDLPIRTIELAQNLKHVSSFFTQAELTAYHQLYSSDAHNLGNILERVFFVELEIISIAALLVWMNRAIME